MLSWKPTPAAIMRYDIIVCALVTMDTTSLSVATIDCRCTPLKHFPFKFVDSQNFVGPHLPLTKYPWKPKEGLVNYIIVN